MILTYIIINVLATNMHQRMGEVCIRHLESIIHRPQCGAIGITDSRETSTRRRVRLEHDERLPRTLSKIRRVYIRLNKIHGRSMRKIAREDVLGILNWLAGVELCRTIIVRVAVDN
jgi:hypothetical protein